MHAKRNHPVTHLFLWQFGVVRINNLKDKETHSQSTHRAQHRLSETNGQIIYRAFMFNCCGQVFKVGPNVGMAVSFRVRNPTSSVSKVMSLRFTMNWQQKGSIQLSVKLLFWCSAIWLDHDRKTKTLKANDNCLYKTVTTKWYNTSFAVEQNFFKFRRPSHMTKKINK